MLTRSRLRFFLGGPVSPSSPRLSSYSPSSSSSLSGGTTTTPPHSGSGGNDFRSSPKIADEFQHVLLRNRWSFDHVAIDVGYLCAVAGRFTRDLIGSDRDAEAVKIVQKQINGQILRRLGGNKSLALMLDGSEPLWKVQHMRVHPGKRFPEKFYRSAASPMVYLLEDRLRAIGPDARPAPAEFIVSGAGVPGPAEGKMSAWMLDLATRVPQLATTPATAPAVTPNDSVCLVGHTDLFLSVLGATPFHNVTAITFNAGEVKSLSLKDCLAWLGLGDLLVDQTNATAAAAAAAATDGTGQANTAVNVQQQKLAAVRTDIVLLYLFANGISSTDLTAFGGGVAFADLMDAYLAELSNFTPETVTVTSTTANGGASTTLRYFSGVLFDEHPLAQQQQQQQNNTPLPSLRMKPDALARVLARAARRPITYPDRDCPVSANYIEVLLQTHAMIVSGGIQNYGWVSPQYGGNVPEKHPRVPLDQFIGHLRAAASSSHNTSNNDKNSGVLPVYISASRDRTFALTGLESLLLTSPEPAIIDQVVPMYSRGHTMPGGVAGDIVNTKDVFEALAKTRAALRGLVASATASSSSSVEGSGGMSVATAHPAILHFPTHYLVKAPGARGPPPGWSYHSVNLGLKAEAMNIRYSLNASDTALLRDLAASAADSGLSHRNHLFAFDSLSDDGTWKEVHCDHVSSLINTNNNSNDDKKDVASSSSSSPPPPLSSLRVLTWNVQFNRHSGERTPLGRDGIDWCGQTRYLALSRILEDSNADVIAMQEAEPQWCTFLSRQPWVRDGYAMSCLESSHVVNPWGVLMLVRNRVAVPPMEGDETNSNGDSSSSSAATAAAVAPFAVKSFDHANVPAFSGHTSAMPEVAISLGPGLPCVAVGSMHLLAPYSQNNVNNRETQLTNLVKHLETASTSIGGAGGASSTSSSLDGNNKNSNAATVGARILMGDFNDYPTKKFRFPSQLGYRDAWEELHPRCDTIPPPQMQQTTPTTITEADAEERGYTIDGVANPYAGKIIEPEFFGRADRVMYAAVAGGGGGGNSSSNSTQQRLLQPVHAELVGTAPVREVLSGGGGVTHLVERPQEPIPEYLFPSDHFGVLVEFQVL